MTNCNEKLANQALSEATRSYTIYSPSMGIDQKDTHHTDPPITTVWGRFYLYVYRWLGLLRVSVDRFVVGRIVIRLVVVGRVILGQRLL